jgi:hypothetical protein
MNLFKRSGGQKPAQRIIFEELERRIVLDASLEMMAYDPIFADTAPERIEESMDDWGLADQPDAQAPSLISAQQGLMDSSLDVVLVSDSVDDLDNLVAAISDDAQIVIYNAEKDDSASVNSALEELTRTNGAKISNLGIIAHGEPGRIQLGADSIDLDNVESFKSAFTRLGANLTEDGQIHLYGCSVAANTEGKDLVNHLAGYTSAHVFASDDRTGGPNSDWDLEFASDSSIMISSMLKPDLISSVNTELSLDVSVDNPNPAPLWNNPQSYPGLISVAEDQGDTVTAVLGASGVANSDILNLTDPSSIPGNSATLTDLGTGLQIQGASGDLNEVLDTLSLKANTNPEGVITIGLYADDTGGGESDFGSVDIYAHKNGAPSFPGSPFPYTVVVPKGVTTGIASGLSFVDSSNPDGQGPLSAETDAGSYSATLMATSTSGVLSSSSPTPGITVTAAGDGSSSTLTYTGSAGNVNAALAGLQFTSDQTGNDGVAQITIKDNGSVGLGSENTISGVINLDVQPANQPPQITAPNSLTTSAIQPLVFTSNGNPIWISDPDAGDNHIDVALQSTNGNMTLSGTAGLTFIEGDGQYDEYMNFRGSINDINAALDGAIFNPSSPHTDFFVGTSHLSVSAWDLGATGVGGDGFAQSSVDMEFTDPGFWGRWPRI